MRASVIGAALLAVVIWGASPVATKVAVAELPPLLVSLLRTVIGGLVALAILLALRLRLPSARRQKHTLLLSGFCGFVFFPLVFSFGVARTSSLHASMILACLPLFTGAIASLWDRHWPARHWWLGCALALGGELLLVSAGTESTGTARLDGDLLVLAANGFASLGYVAGARLQREGYPAVSTTFWGSAIPAVVMLPVVLALMAGTDLAPVRAPAWSAVLYLGLLVTILGYILWYYALGQGGIARMGLFQFFQPVSGVVLATLLLGERFDSLFVLASGLTLAGVFVATRRR